MPPAQPIASDDDEARYWLALLRDRTNAEKCEARIVLANMFERRGQHAAAVALLEKNREWGYETVESHEALARLYTILVDRVPRIRPPAGPISSVRRSRIRGGPFGESTGLRLVPSFLGYSEPSQASSRPPYREAVVTRSSTAW